MNNIFYTLLLIISWLLNTIFGFMGISVIIGAIINKKISKFDKEMMFILGSIILLISYVIYINILGEIKI